MEDGGWVEPEPETLWTSPQPRLAPVPETLVVPAAHAEVPALDIPAIHRSLQSMTSGAQKYSGDFYGYLWAANPRLREMFPPVMNAQNDRLFGALIRIVSLLDRPDVLARYLAQLGADHRKYGVRPEHYALVGDALLRALRRHCPAWDDRAEAAWAAAYGVAADAMISGAESCPGPAAWRGRVLGHERRAQDLAVLTIQTDQPIGYEPGQYITIQHPKWPRVWRQFSVASAPAPSEDLIELHVRQVPGGWVSTALTRDTGVPDELIIGPPVGTMTAEAANGHDMLLVAGGTGLAPMKALAEDVLARDESAMAGGWGSRRNITLLCGARTPLDLYAMPQLAELARSYPWLQVVPVVSDDPGWAGEKGSVVDAALARDWAGRHAFVAGPAKMIEKTASGLAAAGMSEDEVHFDETEAR